MPRPSIVLALVLATAGLAQAEPPAPRVESVRLEPWPDRRLPRPAPGATRVTDQPEGLGITWIRRLDRAATGGQTHTTLEPTAASLGDLVFVTGNHFASLSRDRGKTFEFIDPFSAFRVAEADLGPFCCDQVVASDGRRLFWVMQHDPDGAAGRGGLRLAVADEAGAGEGRWHVYDLDAMLLRGERKRHLDYNGLVVTERYVYLTTMMVPNRKNRDFKPVLVRIPLDEAVAGTGLQAQFVVGEPDTVFRAAKGVAGTMYWGSQPDYESLRVWSWEERPSAEPQSWSVAVEPWSDHDFDSSGPGGEPWLAGSDGSLTAGWAVSGTDGETEWIGFAWNAAGEPQRMPRPHVRLAIVRLADRAVFEPHIWNTRHAFAYADVATDTGGRIGITLAYGGGAHHPGHAVGYLDTDLRGWTLARVAESEHSPRNGKWGDYLSIQALTDGGWLATGYVLQHSPSHHDAVPILVKFRAE